jgi:NAD(P)-dependent dehydrogenase (short-subunit alcohol dehydrogenase family)
VASSEPIALVTGGNRGIGFEICRRLAQAGVRVLLGSRDLSRGGEAAERLAAEGLRVSARELDLRSEASIRDLVERIETQLGRLDILVNNAGVFLDKDGAATTIDLDRVRLTMETNLYGPILLCRAVLPLMRRHGFGRIVNLSSQLGSLSEMDALYPAYRMSKTALNAYCRILAAELAGSGILVNSMCPGWVKTEMGGPNAVREVADSVDTALWLATLPDDGPTGGFFKDREPLPW